MLGTILYVMQFYDKIEFYINTISSYQDIQLKAKFTIYDIIIAFGLIDLDGDTSVFRVLSIKLISSHSHVLHYVIHLYDYIVPNQRVKY